MVCRRDLPRCEERHREKPYAQGGRGVFQPGKPPAMMRTVASSGEAGRAWRIYTNHAYIMYEVVDDE